MAQRPVFVATHPRACSTAFERVFMTSRDRLTCVHEPFGDAFYFGPERLGSRYEDDEQARTDSGFADSTYKSVFDEILALNQDGKRIFIKDIAHYMSPPNGGKATLASSLQSVKRGVGTGALSEATAKAISDGVADQGKDSGITNPTVIPDEVLRQFHFAFLIRHPKHSIPSYWRCTIPPLDKITGFYNFMPEEAGYDELRRIFDYMKDTGIVGPAVTAHSAAATNGAATPTNPHAVSITLVDADEMLANPKGVMRQFCEGVGIEFRDDMLEWDTPEDHAFAKDKFEKWRGFHEDAINSTGLLAREHGHPETTPEQDYAGWVKRYGQEAADVIRDTVEKCLPDYEYLKQFAIKA